MGAGGPLTLTTAGQETECVCSFNSGARTGLTHRGLTHSLIQLIAQNTDQVQCHYHVTDKYRARVAHFMIELIDNRNSYI